MVYNLRPRKENLNFKNYFEAESDYYASYERRLFSKVAKKKRSKKNSSVVQKNGHDESSHQYVCISKTVQPTKPTSDEPYFCNSNKLVSKGSDFDLSSLNTLVDAELIVSCTSTFKRKDSLEDNPNNKKVVSHSCPTEIKVCNYFLTKKSSEGNESCHTHTRPSVDQGSQTDLKLRDLTNKQIPIRKKRQIKKARSQEADDNIFRLFSTTPAIYQCKKRRGISVGKYIRHETMIQKNVCVSTLPPSLENDSNGVTDLIVIESDDESITQSTYNDVENSLRDKKRMTVPVLTPSNLSSTDLDKVCTLAVILGIRVDTRFTRRTSHVVITDYQIPNTTTKYLLGIASRCHVVDMKWIETCLEKKSLVQEDNFIPEGSGPKKCLNLTQSPPLKNITISVEAIMFHPLSSLLQRLCMLCGAKIMRKRETLEESWPKPRLHLFDAKLVPSSSSINELKKDGLLAVELHWIFACVAYYSVASITPFLLPSMREESLKQYGIQEEWL